MTKVPFDTISFSKLSETINEACEWLSYHGFDYPKTRIGEYRKHLIEMSVYHEQNKVDELLRKIEYPVLVNSCFEANEFFNIYMGLKYYEESSLVKRLGDYIKGPKHYRDEQTSTASNRARNIGFELLLSSKFLTNGFDIDLSEDCDIIVKHRHNKIYLECKRPQKIHQIHSNIKGAFSQLNSRYSSAKTTENCFGIIALSIGKVFNPNQVLLIAESPNDLGMKLENINQCFFDEYYDMFKSPGNNKTIGMILHLGIPAEVSEMNLLTCCNEYGLMQIGNEGNDKNLLNEIAKNLKQNI